MKAVILAGGKGTRLQNILKGKPKCLAQIGKTTILRSIAGLEKINNGTINLKGRLLSSNKENIEPEYRNISLSFQENSLFPHYSIKKNIDLGTLRKGIDKKNKIDKNEIISRL